MCYWHILETTGSKINISTWSPCGNLTKIFGRQVLISGGQNFSFSFRNKKDISRIKIAPGIYSGIFLLLQFFFFKNRIKMYRHVAHTRAHAYRIFCTSPLNPHRMSKSSTNFFADVPFPLCNTVKTRV